MMRFATGFCATAVCAIVLPCAPLAAQVEKAVDFDITATDLSGALNQFARQSDRQIVFSSEAAKGHQVRPLRGLFQPRDALGALLDGSGLTYKIGPDDTIVVIPASANETAPPVSPPSSSVTPQSGAEGDGLEYVIVTAQRRAERLADVPITITNLDADALQRASAESLADVAQLVSGVRFDTRGGSTQATIRGVGTSLTLAGAGSNVGIYVDGFNVANPLFSDFQLLNLESVQVLKGPQGTLFGRNTTAGAILLTTSKPSTDTKAIVEASYGSYHSQKYQGYVTTGLTDVIAWDVAAMYSAGDGFVTNVFTNDDTVGRYENWSVRTGLSFDISDRLSVLLRYSHGDTDDPQDRLYSVYELNGAPLSSFAGTPGVYLATKRGQISADNPVEYILKAEALQLTVTADVGFATLTSYSQYREDDAPHQVSALDTVARPGVTLSIQSAAETLTQEFLLASPSEGRLQWTTGLFYFDYTDRWLSMVSSGGSPFRLNLDTGVNSKSIAGFGDVTYEIVDDLFLTGGIRYTRDEVEDAFYRNTAGRTVLPTLETDRVTPRAVLRYALNGESNIYGSYARGYKAAIYNVAGATGVPIKPEALEAFELGYKYSGATLALSLSSYFYDYTDQQLSSAQIINGSPRTLITNAASSHIYGADAELSYEVTDELAVNLTASWIHARYRSFLTAPRFIQNASGSFTNVPADASGFDMMRSPDFTATLGARYRTTLGGGQLSLSGNLYYTSEFYFDPSEQVPQDDYATLAVRVEWTDPTQRYTFALYGNNVTDSKYYVQASNSEFGPRVTWGWPATAGASIRVNFD